MGIAPLNRGAQRDPIGFGESTAEFDQLHVVGDALPACAFGFLNTGHEQHRRVTADIANLKRSQNFASSVSGIVDLHER